MAHEVTPEYRQQLETLANMLIRPERFGKVALAPLIQLPLPELARVYDFPESGA